MDLLNFSSVLTAPAVNSNRDHLRWFVTSNGRFWCERRKNPLPLHIHGENARGFLEGWNGLMGGDWSPDEKSLLVSWHNFERDSALLNGSLDGRATVLLKSSNPEIWHAIPSPNGRLLAIAEADGPKNVWQIENF